jgi:membrane fusion protein (multidrug efflux system)
MIKKNLTEILVKAKNVSTNLWIKFCAMRKPFQIIVLISIIGVFFLPRIFLYNKEMPQGKVVEVYKVAKGDISQTTTLRGTITAGKNFVAIAGYDGTVVSIAMPGKHLPSGSIIARIDNVPAEEAYHAAENAVKIGSEQYNRQLALFQSKTSSRQSVEDKYAALSIAKAALSAAKVNYDKVVFVAPFDGVVGAPMVHVGAHIKAGQEIVAFYDNTSFVAHFDIPSDIAKDLPSEPVVKILDQKYKLDFIQKILTTGSYTVPASVRNLQCARCFSGEKISVELEISNAKNVIIVPKSCVIIRDGKNFIYKVKDGVLELVSVKLGIIEKDRTEVVEGLSEGDEIILKGQYRLFPGMPVTIHEASK